MWYHDHAIGITRTNAYAGLATGYILTDNVEGAVLPLTNLLSGWDIPMIVQDKTFWNPANDPNYALYAAGAQPGDLWYPYIYERALFGKANAPVPSAVPEFWADTMLVNGLVYPYQQVSAAKYRFRILNACNARFLRLSFVLSDAQGEPVGGYRTPVAAPVSAWQIGAEGGFLPTPVQLVNNGVPLAPLVLGPAERADIIVDFSGCAYQNVLLYNDAPAPFPAGAPIFDFYPGNNRNPVPSAPGYGPNTRTLMRFQVGGAANSPIGIPSGFDATGYLRLLPTEPDPNGGRRLPNEQNYSVRHLTLNEAVDAFGRLTQLIGTNLPQPAGGFGQPYLNPPTEVVRYNTIEIWNVYNLTADTHPMHFHLFNVMVLRRRPFRVNQFRGVVPPLWAGPARGPEANETGWKETVQMHPGECTTVAVFIEDPLPGRQVTVGPYSGTLPPSPRTGGDEYVWHCHILEHEEHNMMRPLVAS